MLLSLLILFTQTRTLIFSQNQKYLQTKKCWSFYKTNCLTLLLAFLYQTKAFDNCIFTFAVSIICFHELSLCRFSEILEFLGLCHHQDWFLLRPPWAYNSLTVVDWINVWNQHLIPRKAQLSCIILFGIELLIWFQEYTSVTTNIMCFYWYTAGIYLSVFLSWVLNRLVKFVTDTGRS